MIIRLDTEIYKDDETIEIEVTGEFSDGGLDAVYLTKAPEGIHAIPYEQLYNIERQLVREYEDSYQGE